MSDVLSPRLSPSPREPTYDRMISELLAELDQLADHNNALAERVKVAKAALRDTTALEDAIREAKEHTVENKKRLARANRDGLPDRRARASSCVIPPSMQLLIARSITPGEDAPSASTSPSSSCTVESGWSEVPATGQQRTRATSVPDVYKPLPQTPPSVPAIPQWSPRPSMIPVATGRRNRSLTKKPGSYNLFPNDEADAPSQGSAYAAGTSKCAQAAGQSHPASPQRAADEPTRRARPAASAEPYSGRALTTQLQKITTDLDAARPRGTAATAAEEPHMPGTSPSKRSKKRWEDYLIPRSILTQKPKHERARTLSPTRVPPATATAAAAAAGPRVLSKRAKSTHDLRRKASKGVRFAET